VWRGSQDGIARVARQVTAAGIAVQSTLVVYESMAASERGTLIDAPIVDLLHPAARAQWRAMSRSGPPGFRFHAFMKRVVGELHRAGGTVMAGTDAMGMPLIAPGASLLRELELLNESGLTPYEALRAATVVPAAFLNQTSEFGRIAVGHRADVILAERNPVEDVRHVRAPVGVMVRGEWFPRARLDQLLASLAAKD
jgi:imidazolonepropionase-like amidohydrolase